MGGGGEGLEGPPRGGTRTFFPCFLPDGHGERQLLPPLGLQLVELQEVLPHAAGELGGQAPNEHAAGAKKWRWGAEKWRWGAAFPQILGTEALL